MSNQAEGISVAATASAKPVLPTKAKARAGNSTKLAIWLKGLILPVVVLIVWQTAGELGMVSATMLPTPLQILTAAGELLASGELLGHLQISIMRAATGFLLGGAIGLLAGLAVGFSNRVEHSLDPSVQMLRTIPHLAVIPLFILWFGFGELSKVLLIAKGAFFPLYVNTFLGIRSVDAKLFDVARVLQFSRWKQITKLIIPAALPNILLGVRLSLGAAWLGLVVAELMGSSEGVGYLIMDARQFSQTSIVFVGIVIFALVGKATDSLVRYLEKKWLKWREHYSG
ncbi:MULTISPECIES: ABC transporter permease [Brevibacillus]|uniref:Putative aliphatic sulfonates transport permease protein SsuC n=1 Tax=Brevibacillus parabrevis TaxID=54914 RepID=A0A4Y3PQ79_BREPA|nr:MULTISPECIES: ABC transporter permease [Brevibacillus]MBU8713882.1 ABC transporter permease [Brevibacillus parabrevis]MDH6350660.1 sulfonate transport system permease protein [Brevibacillus sp. 1238]MED2255441.1 ABC transporter permease [Brevibacillus parabrevis]RNB94807.1 ABC transporter permease [Brevibacillus parabrevis]WDV94597.1 ABC transporter permease [Brevibacillus parabrevis]